MWSAASVYKKDSIVDARVVVYGTRFRTHPDMKLESRSRADYTHAHPVIQKDGKTVVDKEVFVTLFYVVPDGAEDGIGTIQSEVTMDEADAIEARVKELHGAERNVTVRELRQCSNRSMVARHKVPVVPDKYYYARVMGRAATDGGELNNALKLWTFETASLLVHDGQPRVCFYVSECWCRQ
jgi:hypothetical protein